MTTPIDLETVSATALRLLGPSSTEALATPATLVLVRRRVADGYTLEDALLAEAHHIALEDRRVADEFLAVLLSDLNPIAHGRLSEPLRRFLDTGDLVQSVMGDLWSSLEAIEFRTRSEFCGLLAQRLGWKAKDKGRAFSSSKRREDLRVPLDPSGSQADSRASSQASTQAQERPEDAMVREEEKDLIHLMLLRLSSNDRDLLQQHLGGKSPEAIAQERGMTRDAVYKALQRAVARARDLGKEMGSVG